MAAIKVIEGFVLPSLLRFFIGLICQVRVLHGRDVFLFLNGTSRRSKAGCATSVHCDNNFYYSIATKVG